MDRTTPFTGNAGGSNNPTTTAKVDGAAKAAHATTDKVADAATAEVGRLSGSAHRAVNSAADAASAATNWASDVAGQAAEIQTHVVDSASAAIRKQPITIVASALAIGYLLGRL